MTLHQITPHLGRAVLLIVALLLLPPAQALPPEPTTIEARPRTLEDSDSEIWSVALSPDGKTVAAAGGQGSKPGTLTLWDVATGMVRVRIQEPLDLRSVAFSPDGKLLVTADEFERTAKVRDAATGRVLRTLGAYTQPVNAVAFSPDGRTAALAVRDKTITLWDPATGQRKATLEGHTSGVFSVAFVDNQRLLSGGGDNTGRLWDLTTGKERLTLQGHQKAVECVAASPDGKTLDLLQDKGYFRRNYQRAKEKRRISSMYCPLSASSLGYSTCAENAAVVKKVYSPVAARTRRRASSIRLTPSSGRCCVGIMTPSPVYVSLRTAKRCSPAAPTRPSSVGRRPGRRCLRAPSFKDHGFQTWVALITPDGKELITAGADGTVKIRPVPPTLGPGRTVSGISIKCTLKGHKGIIACATLAPGGKMLATGGFDKTIHLWDLIGNKKIDVLTSHEGVVRCLAFAPDGKTLASASTDKTVRLWDVASGKQKAVSARFESGAAGVAFSPDGKLLAICAGDDSNFRKPGDIKLLDLATNREREEFAGAKVPALSVAFSPDGKLLASASPTAPSVNIWDFQSGKLVTKIQQSASVRHLEFSPDGKLLATGHGNGARRGDGSIQFSDTSTWQEVAFGQTYRSLTVSVAFSPDGRTLATAGMDGAAILWDVPARKMARKDK